MRSSPNLSPSPSPTSRAVTLPGGGGVTARGFVGRVVFWFAAVAFGLAVFAPFIYAGGSGTCAAAEDHLETIVLGDAQTVTFEATVGTIRVSTDGTYAGGATYAAPTSPWPTGNTIGGPNTVDFYCVDEGNPYEYTTSVSNGWCVEDSTCDDTDVVLGLSQISAQIQGLSGFLFIVLGFCTFVLVASAAIAFVGFHRGR